MTPEHFRISLSLVIIISILFTCIKSISIDNESDYNGDTIIKRALQKSHEKSQSEKWQTKFLRRSKQFDQTSSLIELLQSITKMYLSDCPTVILYDSYIEKSKDFLLERLLRDFPNTYLHGQITEDYRIERPDLIIEQETCYNYILFLKDVMHCKKIIGPQQEDRVIIISRSSQWRVYEFLSNEVSQSFLNLLVISMSEKPAATLQTELPYILYTHKLYIDALGSSSYQVLTSWRNHTFTRPDIDLFPKKIVDGFAGHRFVVSLAHQPPFVIKRGFDINDNVIWEGIEVRLVELLGKLYNFTIDYREARDVAKLGSGVAVCNTVKNDGANLGIAGLYITNERIEMLDMTNFHSQDCAAFVSLTSTALPRYRAIMGPFHWSVWVSLTIIYLFAIIPLAFSDRHTLRHLLEKPKEIENMFWYVFGTFTNCFTFTGRYSWSKSDKLTTRILIGFYWLFTIIITACYTGSIIAFVTLPVYPEAVDNIEQLLRGRYQIGTLNKDGWQYWFDNSSDPKTQKLLRKLDLVPDVESGLKNTTKAFFWPYAFLGSRAQLGYIVRTNFTTQNKRNLLHITTECLAPFSVGLAFKKDTIFSHIIEIGILQIVQSGLFLKIKNDVEWLTMRSATGKLLAANSYGNILDSWVAEDRSLTLDDTQGMFLLLGAGFLLGAFALLTECFGGCVNLCKLRKLKRISSTDTIVSNYRTHHSPTPRQKLDSLKYNSLSSDTTTKDSSDCIVHKDTDEDKQMNRNGNESIEKEIDKLFDFDKFFGKNEIKPEISEEELDENGVKSENFVKVK